MDKLLIKRNIISVALVVYTLVMLLPPLLHGYVYPTNGDDTAFHLQYFDSLKNGESLKMQYFGQAIVGYPLVWMSNLSGASIESLFLWFNFGVLWLIGIMALVLVGGVVDWRAGLLAMLLIVFATPNTLNLFDIGVIFDLLTIGVVLPLFLYCVVKVWAMKKRRWVFPLVISLALLAVVHTMSVAHVIQAGEAYVSSESQAIGSSDHLQFFLICGALPVVSIGAFLFFSRKSLAIDMQVKVLMIALGVFIVSMWTLTLVGFIGYSLRIGLDMTIVLSMLVACFLGVLMRSSSNRMALGFICAVVLLVSLPRMIAYFNYQTAVKPVDMEAIAYVNGLSGQYYSASFEVAPWIYGRFLNKEYKDGELPCIVRSKPMTPRTTEGTVQSWWTHDQGRFTHDTSGVFIEPEGKVTEFRDGDLIIEVIH